MLPSGREATTDSRAEEFRPAYRATSQIGIINKISAYALQDEGADTIEANELLGLEVDLRRYDQCTEIFLDLGLRRVRVMTNNPLKLQALEQHGLEIVERVSLRIEPHEGFAGYLRTKKERMGHLVSIA